ncbi:hypothetical protein TNCV_3852971 [Trichonephila clavipes]|nr:hypothetical protein TNCV_3852971 [Trichonephila clavipes]
MNHRYVSVSLSLLHLCLSLSRGESTPPTTFHSDSQLTRQPTIHQPVPRAGPLPPSHQNYGDYGDNIWACGKWHVNYGVPVPERDVPPHQNFNIKSRINDFT